MIIEVSEQFSKVGIAGKNTVSRASVQIAEQPPVVGSRTSQIPSDRPLLFLPIPKKNG